MLYLILGLVIFFAVHSINMLAPAWRMKMIQRLGMMGWMGVYSLISLVGFALMVWGYDLARQMPTVVYVPPTWLRHVAFLLLVPVFPMLLATYFPGKISRTLKHPMLTAVKTWALAHLLMNGMLADLFLFGSFLLWAGLNRFSVKRRPREAVPAASHSRWNDAIAIVGGLALYVAFLFFAHRLLIGVQPIGVQWF